MGSPLLRSDPTAVRGGADSALPLKWGKQAIREADARTGGAGGGWVSYFKLHLAGSMVRCRSSASMIVLRSRYLMVGSDRILACNPARIQARSRGSLRTYFEIAASFGSRNHAAVPFWNST